MEDNSEYDSPEMENSTSFSSYNKECPCYIDETGQCDIQVTYNGHVNDPRYDPCCEDLCPVFFWISKFI